MPKRSTAQSQTIIPPINGWNTKDPISGMDPSFAVEMENFFPNFGTVDLRNGYIRTATNSNACNNFGVIFEYVKTDGNNYLIWFSQTNQVYNASASGAATNITGAATVNEDSFLVNYQNRVYMADTTTATDVHYWTATGNIQLAAFVGPSGDDKALWKMTTYKNRIYFIQTNAAIMWYSGLNAVTGTLTSFSLESLFKRGGRLYHIGTISQQNNITGEYFIAISEKGEVILYQGDYPGSTTWTVTGHFDIPAPLGKRSFFSWGNDTVILTREGALSLIDIMNVQRGGYSYLTENISSAYRDLVVTAANAGYGDYIQGIHYPSGPYILISIRGAAASTFVQLVMNTVTKAWCKFSNMTALSWALFSDNLYFSSNPTSGGSCLFKADTGDFDDDGNSGIATRTIKLRPAYNYFGNPETVKQFVEARPILYQQYGLSLTMDADIDYANTTAVSTITDTSNTSYVLYNPRLGLTGIGKAASIRIDGTMTTNKFSLQAIEVLWNEGDII